MFVIFTKCFYVEQCHVNIVACILYSSRFWWNANRLYKQRILNIKYPNEYLKIRCILFGIALYLSPFTHTQDLCCACLSFHLSMYVGGGICVYLRGFKLSPLSKQKKAFVHLIEMGISLFLKVGETILAGVHYTEWKLNIKRPDYVYVQSMGRKCMDPSAISRQ